MTLEELSRLQDILLEQRRTGMPSSEQIATALERQSVEVAAWFRFRQYHGRGVTIVMLLGALAVATAWITHGGRFRACHGRPPIAAPAV